jgi:hypothetical protein
MLPERRAIPANQRPPYFSVDREVATRVFHRIMRMQDHCTDSAFADFCISQIAAAISAARREGRR